MNWGVEPPTPRQFPHCLESITSIEMKLEHRPGQLRGGPAFSHNYSIVRIVAILHFDRT